MLVPKPVGANIINYISLFKKKEHVDGSLEQYNARLVANDLSQRPGIDCDEIFNPMVKPITIRTVLSLFVSKYWHIR